MYDSRLNSIRKLKSIARFLRSSGTFYFLNYNLDLFVQHIETDPILNAVITGLVNKCPEICEYAKELATKGTVISRSDPENKEVSLSTYRLQNIKYFEAWVVFCFCYIKACRTNGGSSVFSRVVVLESSEEKVSVKTLFFNDFVQPIVIYLENSIGDSISAQYLLKRYKIKCEWYDRRDLQGVPEVLLTQGHLDAYLFDQGYTYSLSETSVPSGRIDNFAINLGFEDKREFSKLPDAIVAEAKIFDGSSSIQEVKNQTEKRVQELGFSEGYAVIYNKNSKRIVLTASNITFENGFYVYRTDTYTIYFIVINLDETFYDSTKTVPEVSVEIQ